MKIPFVVVCLLLVVNRVDACECPIPPETTLPALDGVTAEQAFGKSQYHYSIDMDQEAAARWEFAAAKLDHPIAMFNVGTLMTKASDVASQSNAQCWLRRAAKAGVPDAAISLIQIAEQRGDEVSADDVSMLRNVALTGNVQALSLMARQILSLPQGSEDAGTESMAFAIAACQLAPAGSSSQKEQCRREQQIRDAASKRRYQRAIGIASLWFPGLIQRESRED
jgi:TPR repeat protein